MSSDDPLADYRRKRDLDNTPEPAGAGHDPDRQPIFVVQHHRSSTEHYDVRLEVDGVLASWSVPKGPSTDPSEKRLAVRTEDHPLDYADFEGTIPEQEYGGGAVAVWDIGPYRNLTVEDGRQVPVGKALEDGHVKVWLEGKKLQGGYAFVHARLGGEDDNWLLVKEDDDAADARRNPTSTQPESVLSNRTVQQIAEGEGEDD